MTLLEARNYILSEVDDLDGTYFTPPQVLRFINQAVGEVQKKLIDAGEQWYLKVTPDSGPTALFTVANQQSYTYPDDLMEVNRIELVQNPGLNETRHALPHMTLNQRDMFSAQGGEPDAYYLGKNSIELVPYPQIAGRLIRLFYNYRVVPLVLDADILDVPEQFCEYVCLIAMYNCYIKDDRDPSILVRRMDEVQKRLERKAIERMKNEPRSVVVTGDYSGGGCW